MDLTREYLLSHIRNENGKLHFLNWIGRHELAIFVVLAIVAVGGWGFAELADEVTEGDTMNFDRRGFLMFRNPADHNDPLGADWFEESVRDVTALGSTAVLLPFTLAGAGFLAVQRKWRGAVLMVVAIAGGMIASNLLKGLFSRERPDIVEHLNTVYTASFPSGHSMMSAVCYLTLAAVIARLSPRKAVKAYMVIVAVILTILVGLSRVYLGVHWPTDVMAGWAAGTMWALLCWAIARALQRKGVVEQDVEIPEEEPRPEAIS